jgi:hypothetical protein
MERVSFSLYADGRSNGGFHVLVELISSTLEEGEKEWGMRQNLPLFSEFFLSLSIDTAGSKNVIY